MAKAHAQAAPTRRKHVAPKLPDWLRPVALAGQSLTLAGRTALAQVAVDLASHKYDPPPPPTPLTIEQERDILAHRITETHDAINEAAISQVVEMLEAAETLAHEWRYARGESDYATNMESAVIIALEAIGSMGAAKLGAVRDAIDGLRLYRGADVKPADLREIEPAKPEGGGHD